MNWRRGFIRVWIIISYLYVAVVLAIGGPGAVSNVKTIATPYQRPSSIELANNPWGRELARRGAELSSEKRHREKREIARRQLQVFAVAAVVPPALFWVILYAGFWVVRGFRR